MKNKGYYGWIHSLNEAGMQAHKKGIEMLAEQHARKGEMLTEANKPNRTPEGMAAKKARETADTAKRRENREAAAKAAITAASSGGGELSDFNFDGFEDRVAEIRSEKQAAGSGVQRVETGANLGKANITPQTLNPNIETVPRYPDYPIAQEARAETARLSIPAGNANAVAVDASDYVMGDEEEPEDEGKYELPTQNWKSLKLESITSKISRFLRN